MYKYFWQVSAHSIVGKLKWYSGILAVDHYTLVQSIVCTTNIAVLPDELFSMRHIP